MTKFPNWIEFGSLQSISFWSTFAHICLLFEQNKGINTYLVRNVYANAIWILGIKH